jgi:hypothetical protein
MTVPWEVPQCLFPMVIWCAARLDECQDGFSFWLCFYQLDDYWFLSELSKKIILSCPLPLSIFPFQSKLI